MNRKQKREEEAKIIAQMQEALAQDSQTEEQELQEQTPVLEKRKTNFFDSTTPEQVHCKRCKTLMENGTCPTCGFKIYVPMDQKKRDKIRLVTTVVAMAVFLVLFLIMQIQKS